MTPLGSSAPAAVREKERERVSEHYGARGGSQAGVRRASVSHSCLPWALCCWGVR